MTLVLSGAIPGIFSGAPVPDFSELDTRKNRVDELGDAVMAG